MDELKKSLEGIGSSIKSVDIGKSPDDSAPTLSIIIKLSATDDICSVTNKYARLVQEHFDALKHSLFNHSFSSPLIARFQFPQNIDTACQQYLIYFAEFLRDLGINADTELISKGNELLFSIVPKDKDEALSKIKEALAFYLKLPDFYDHFKFTNFNASEPDVIVQKYLATIEHLRSQLRLAEALICINEPRDQNLKPRSLTVKKNIFETSLQEIIIERSPEDTKSFFGGILKLGSWKKGPVEINTPKLLDGLKKLLKG